MRKLFGTIYIIGSTLLLPSQLLFAQDTLEEIVVTAQRREQPLQDVPISAVTFNAELIEQNDFQGARDFILMTPNVAFSENDSQGQKNGDITIRGISDLTSGGNERIIQSRPAVGYFVDGFSVSSIASGSANPLLNDVERVEILRGPQGIYFGRNATGGAINITSKKPNENPYGKVKVGIGEFDTYEAGAIANVPILDNLFVRGGVHFRTSDGIVENLSSTGPDSDYDNLNLRVALRWQPGDWTFDVVGQLIDEEQGNEGLIPSSAGGAGFLNLGPGAAGATDPGNTCGLGADIFVESGNDDENCENADTRTNINNNLIMAHAEYAAERFTFTSITGRIEGELDQLSDLDNSGFDVFNRINDYTSESWSQEIRITSAGDDWRLFDRPMTWTVGGIYYDDEFQVNNAIIAGADVAPGFVGFLTVPGERPNENQQFVERNGWAIFFDVGLDVLDNVTLSVGGRYSEDNDKQFWRNTFASFDCGTRPVGGALAAGCALNPALNPNNVFSNSAGGQFISGGRYAQNLFTDASNDGSDFSPRIALTWRVNDDHSAYFTWSEGYRAAGTRVSPDSNVLSDQLAPAGAVDTRSIFDKETITNYEIGWKGYLNNRRTLIEAAVFRMDWNDMQVRLDRFVCVTSTGQTLEVTAAGTDCPSGPIPDNRVFNADSARSQGVEVAVQSLIGEHFQVGASLGYQDAEFKDFVNSPNGDVSGKKLPNSPDLTIGVMGQVNWNLGPAESYLRLEANHRSGTYTRFQDVTNPLFPFQTRDFVVINLRAGVDWGKHLISLSVSNLFDEDYTLGVDGFASTGTPVRPHPRFVSASWSMEF